MNITFTDIDTIDDSILSDYENSLIEISDYIVNQYINNHPVQINLLTDRFMLKAMNNCNAGIDSITLAPDGLFYICPAFYYDKDKPIGSPTTGIDILNRQLFDINQAPICRICDAYHCRRCVWLNKITTNEVNTPSKQQCVMAHIERKVSGLILKKMREYGDFMPDITIPDLSYSDPLDLLIKHN